MRIQTVFFVDNDSGQELRISNIKYQNCKLFGVLITQKTDSCKMQLPVFLIDFEFTRKYYSATTSKATSTLTSR